MLGLFLGAFCCLALAYAIFWAKTRCGFTTTPREESER